MDQLNNITQLTPAVVLWTSFMVGVLGSIHCVGMCGGIAIACSRTRQKNIGYQVGRLIGYISLALVAFNLGQGLNLAMEATGLSGFFGILMGIMLIWIGIKSYLGGMKKDITKFLPKKLYNYYSLLLKRENEEKSFQTSFFIGVFTIFLPHNLTNFFGRLTLNLF